MILRVPRYKVLINLILVTNFACCSFLFKIHYIFLRLLCKPKKNKHLRNLNLLKLMPSAIYWHGLKRISLNEVTAIHYIK